MESEPPQWLHRKALCCLRGNICWCTAPSAGQRVVTCAACSSCSMFHGDSMRATRSQQNDCRDLLLSQVSLHMPFFKYHLKSGIKYSSLFQCRWGFDFLSVASISFTIMKRRVGQRGGCYYGLWHLLICLCHKHDTHAHVWVKPKIRKMCVWLIISVIWVGVHKGLTILTLRPRQTLFCITETDVR